MYNSVMDEIKLYVLNDDRCNDANFCNKHGFSLFVKTNESAFLFDAGQDDSFIKNAELLGLNLQNLDFIVLSHGHYDHADGLKYLSKKYKVFCHPKCLTWRKSMRTKLYSGMCLDKDKFLSNFDVKFSKVPLQLNDATYFLGEIKRIFDYECKQIPSTCKNGKPDKVKDDSGVVIKTKHGLVVITGCGHSGICNIIEQAKRITGEQTIYAVIGGLHLMKIDEQTQKTVEYLLANKVRKLYIGHCTSDEVCNYIIQKTKGAIDTHILSTGQIIDL